MHAPIKDFKCAKYPAGNITQWFGENPALYGQFCQTDALGTKTCLAGHNGIDIVAPWGTPILCVEDGMVADVQNNPNGYGKYLRIITDTNNEWTYGHLSEIQVTIGDVIKAGTQIGLMGNTGFVVSGPTPYWQYNPYAGTHLHLGKRKLKYSASGWSASPLVRKFLILNYSNGFFGSVDYRQDLERATSSVVAEDPKEIERMQLTVLSLLNQIIGILKLRR